VFFFWGLDFSASFLQAGNVKEEEKKRGRKKLVLVSSRHLFCNSSIHIITRGKGGGRHAKKSTRTLYAMSGERGRGKEKKREEKRSHGRRRPICPHLVSELQLLRTMSKYEKGKGMKHANRSKGVTRNEKGREEKRKYSGCVLVVYVWHAENSPSQLKAKRERGRRGS